MTSDTTKAFALGCGITAGAGFILILLLAVVWAMVGNGNQDTNGMRAESAQPLAQEQQTSRSSSPVADTARRETPIVLELETRPKETKPKEPETEEAKADLVLYEGMFLSSLEEKLGPGRQTRRFGDAASYVWETAGGTLDATFEDDELVDWTVGGVPRGSISRSEPQPVSQPQEGIQAPSPPPTQTQPMTSARPASPAFTNYDVEITSFAGTTFCVVTFHSLPETTDIAAKVMRFEVANAVRKDGNREIYAMAYNDGDDELPESVYGGALIYNPVDGQTRTLDERTGVRTITNDAGAYFVKFKVEEEDDTASIIEFDTGPCSVSIVFPQRPSNSAAKAAVLEVIESLKARRLDLSVYVFTGDKSNEMTWQKVRAANGYFLVATYEAATGKISLNEGWD